MLRQFINHKIDRTMGVLLLLIGLTVLVPKPAAAVQSVTFGWDPSTDGSIVGYNIYYGTASHVYTNKVSTGNTTAATVSNLIEGTTYYFAVTTYDLFNQESVLSGEVTYTVPAVQLTSSPVIGQMPVTNTAAVGQSMTLGITATGVGPFNYSIGSGAASGARINPLTGMLTWNPQAAQAGSTNAFSVIVTDSQNPPMSATNTFFVMVQDYVHLSINSTVMAANANGGTALQVYSSTSVTNLQFVLNYPPDMLANITISAINPLVGTAVITPIASGQAMISVGTSAGQSIAGLQTLGTIGFQALGGQNTKVAYLNMVQPTASKSDGTSVSDTDAATGRVTIVGQQSMVEAGLVGGVRSLVVYGPLSASYQVESCHALGTTNAWVQTMAPFTMTNLSQVFQLAPDTNSTTFYRTRKL